MNQVVRPMLVLGWLLVPFCWGWAAEPNKEQERAIAAVVALGGKVTVDKKSPDRPVIGVDLWDTKVTDAELEHLKGLTQLRTLRLQLTQVTDTGLKYVKRLAKLQALYLGGTKVTDTGLEHLKGLTQLQELNLWGTKITDAGLVHLKGLTQLQRLHLGSTQVTDAGVNDLQKALPKVTIFH